MEPSRFWSKACVLDESECWEWQGSRNWQGYGWAQPSGKNRGAHRVAWLLTHGSIPDGLWVLHHCDNPPCVNPSHLFLGTATDNERDKVRKGRHHRQRGCHPWQQQGPVRTPDQIRAARAEYRERNRERHRELDRLRYARMKHDPIFREKKRAISRRQPVVAVA